MTQAVSAVEKKLKTCFVISPIGEEGSPTRERSNKVLKHIIRKALQPLDYKVERADEINLPGTINTQVVERVFGADLVVADLTERNPNVLYELAIRHAAKKPALHLIAHEEEIPFDINQIRLIKFNLADPDSIEDAQRRLQEQTQAVEKGELALTPVQIAQVLTSLQGGEARDRQVLGVLQGIAEGISQLRSRVDDIARIVAKTERPSTFAQLAALSGGAFSPLSEVAREALDELAAKLRQERKPALQQESKPARPKDPDAG